ncbi:hypothetical protein GCM10009757_18390 [Streptomyces cheonanensis]|uniref:Uncharacterized protein n=1 Tax=Streptomyces cheonanensis TaxID=312720 RepID=A0ABP5GMI6_9ACTN
MDAGGGDGDPDLAGAGLGVGDLLVTEVLGRAVGVELDGVHGGEVVLPGGPVGRWAGARRCADELVSGGGTAPRCNFK